MKHTQQTDPNIVALHNMHIKKKIKIKIFFYCDYLHHTQVFG